MLVKRGLLYLLLLLLFVPALQQLTGFVSERPLAGAFEIRDLPRIGDLELKSWLNGSFQSDFNEALEQHIGFRNTLVRTYNEWQYHIFRKANAEGVIAGRKGELFEEDYLKAASGMFFIGEEHWQRKAMLIRRLQDTLQKLDKRLLVVFEPGKGTTLRHKAPSLYANQFQTTNYDALKQAFIHQGVAFVDLQQCFRDWNDTSRFLLFPHTGTHWSYYGAWLAADTLLRYLSGLMPGQITPIRQQALDLNRSIRHPDDDIWLAMNMLSKPPSQNLAYPVLQIGQKPAQRPSVLVIGDSFYFNWQSDGIMDALSEGGEFWYYNKIRWDHQGREIGPIAEETRIPLALAHDLILIMITERFHQNFAWKFDEQLYTHFFDDQTPQRQRFFNELVAANEQFTRLIADARKRGIDLTKRLWMEADYLMYEDFQHHPERYTSRDDRIAITMMAIRSTPEWLEAVARKARERDMDLETMIRMDAEWIVDHQSQ
ncbi:MAG: hypothetical protein IPM52_02355 [Bacteroidetes bacterium]|nr:hypothetical protein [Bacteroidota bacterium]